MTIPLQPFANAASYSIATLRGSVRTLIKRADYIEMVCGSYLRGQ